MSNQSGHMSNQRQSIGYVVVRGVPGWSFRIKGVQGSTLPGMDCPMWFPSRWAADHAAKSLMNKVVEELRKRGIIVSLAGSHVDGQSIVRD